MAQVFLDATATNQLSRIDRPVELCDASGLRVVAVHKRLHQQPVLALGDIERMTDVGFAATERLLAEDVLARLQSSLAPLDVHRVG